MFRTRIAKRISPSHLITYFFKRSVIHFIIKKAVPLVVERPSEKKKNLIYIFKRHCIVAVKWSISSAAQAG